MGMNEKQQLYVLIAVFVLILVGEGVYGYFSFERRAEFMDSLEEITSEEDAAEQKLATVESLREKSREMQAIIEEYVTILPSDEEARNDTFLVDIDNFARNSGLEVISGKASNPKTARSGRTGRKKTKIAQKNFEQLRYRFKLRGTFLNFLKFTNSVENHSRFLRIDFIDIKPFGAEDQDKGEEELVLAEDPRKDIEVMISTYTYSKGGEDK